MKKIFLSILALSFCITSFAQWSNTGDSKTTGNLYVGNPADNTYSKLVLRGPNAPFDAGSKRDFIFEFKDGGSTVLRSERTGGWGSSFEILTTLSDWNPISRLKFYGWGLTQFNDKFIWLGEGTGTVGEEGTQLTFRGTTTSAVHGYMAGYTRASGVVDLRLSVGSGTQDRFVVGGGNGTFNGLFYVNANGNVGIGTESNTYKLEVNGTIRAKEVRVESGWADFVFKPDYQLPTLHEVKAHIDEHKHLPGMPSEAEVQENGVGLAEATTKLLQKVEELTLYAIQQQETIEKLTKEVNELKNDKK